MHLLLASLTTNSSLFSFLRWCDLGGSRVPRSVSIISSTTWHGQQRITSIFGVSSLRRLHQSVIADSNFGSAFSGEKRGAFHELSNLSSFIMVHMFPLVENFSFLGCHECGRHWKVENRQSLVTFRENDRAHVSH